MKEKIMNIKNILRIIISLFIIFSMVKSCAKAYTFDEFISYCEMIRDYSTNNNNKKAARWVLNNKSTIQSYVNSVSNLSDYTTWYFGIKNTTTTYGGNVYLVMQKSGTAWNWNNTIKSTPQNGWLIRRFGTPDTNWNNNGNWQSVALESANMSYYGDSGTYIGLIDQTQADTLNINFSGKEWNNFYLQYAIKHLEFDNTFLNNTTNNGNLFTYYYQGDFYSKIKLQIGSIIPNDSYYYEIYLKDNTTNLIKGTIYCNVADLNIYNGDGALYLDNNQNLYVTTRFLNYSTQYRLEITSYYGSGGDNLYEDIDWFIFLPQNAIIDSNNIISFGSGDFTTQDSTNQIVENQNQNQEENKGFFENLYNNMFTMNSGEVSGEINNLINSLNLTDSGEREIISMIYDEFNREPSDFVISWGTKNITIDGQTIPLIPSGEINFSEKCREEPSLARVKGLINVMVSASLIMAFIIGNHDMILKLLGTENTFLDDDRVEYIVTAEQVAQETLPPPNYPTWSGTDPNYWWHRARKR